MNNSSAKRYLAIQIISNAENLITIFKMSKHLKDSLNEIFNLFFIIHENFLQNVEGSQYQKKFSFIMHEIL